MGNWFAKRGDAAAEDFRKMGPRPNIWRLFLKPGEDKQKEIIFMDDSGFSIWEHTIKVGDDYHPVTCIMDGCRCCNDVDKNVRYKSYIEFYSVFVLDPYVDKQGKKQPGSRRLYAVKGESAQKALARVRIEDAGGNLAGARMRVIRDTDKSPACGNSFKLLARDQKAMVPTELWKPIDFEKALAPLGPKDIEQLLAQKLNYSGDDAMGVSTAGTPEPAFDSTDEIPF